MDKMVPNAEEVQNKVGRVAFKYFDLDLQLKLFTAPGCTHLDDFYINKAWPDDINDCLIHYWSE